MRATIRLEIVSPAPTPAAYRERLAPNAIPLSCRVNERRPGPSYDRIDGADRFLDEEETDEWTLQSVWIGAGGAIVPVSQDPKVNWLQPNPLGIQRHKSPDVWHSGRVMDVLALEGGYLLVGTDTGGLWSIAPDDQTLCLSDSW